jgi:uncharacterized RDD family membrane protein YckC
MPQAAPRGGGQSWLFSQPPPAWGGYPTALRKPSAFWRFKEFNAVQDGSERMLLSPEGAMLSLKLASRLERLMAFMYDAFLIIGLNVLIFVVPFRLLGEGSHLLFTITAFMSFIVNNVYFIYFELAWQGSTPGKRAMRIKVISRKGGALSPYAVVMRNVTRQFEIFLPLISLVVEDGLGIGGPVFAVIWLLAITLLPVWNRDRMRAGDMLADTLVIAAPAPTLAPDLAAPEPDQSKRRWSFTKGQLSIYGDYELMVLEEILRKPLRPGHEGPLFKVAGKIAAKIGVTLPPDMSPQECRDFLTDFYAAERAALEEGRLYGVHKTDQLTPAARGGPQPPRAVQSSTPGERFRQGNW